jgi:subtilisin family serine protease
MYGYTTHYIRQFATRNPARLPLHLQKKIKIAVIDSGAKKDDMRIRGATAARRIRGRNFLPGRAEEWNDSHGHGTHIACLLLDMAPEAELYIAKVSEGWYVEKDQVKCIAQAINWAVQVWDVDIITMSLVLSETHDAIEVCNTCTQPNSTEMRVHQLLMSYTEIPSSYLDNSSASLI